MSEPPRGRLEYLEEAEALLARAEDRLRSALGAGEYDALGGLIQGQAERVGAVRARVARNAAELREERETA